MINEGEGGEDEILEMEGGEDEMIDEGSSDQHDEEWGSQKFYRCGTSNDSLYFI